ncbi:helix-turn-helix domain-containing protein [Roseibium denhamense]|uniref:Helix-turn-helix domain-containing protein n=1 Tax=Roseibium denhamense TaxID=76305 RepID=A0ABY1PPI8_9HYPH|nr:helix-turn-helix domain-containing protein [Roseibium denhamense]MTI06969.1 helix-turn-helix domain-containing protein [Roseibium denhamense]SMP36684.1 Helix-turn-helix domain-containing protein [Roseibium denhamense]
MAERRPFREVKLQWLRLLSCDANINDNAKCVALYIVTAHVNGHTGKAWPSYKTIAEATGKSVKSIQRAIRDLEIGGWLGVQRGNGVGHNTEYRPTDASIIKASQLREKTDKSVPLNHAEGGQICPERRSDVSGKGGQICPPNLEKEINKKPNGREARAKAVAGRAVPVVNVPVSHGHMIREWNAWLARKSLPDLVRFNLNSASPGTGWYRLPGRWPPEDGSEKEQDCLSYFLSRLPAIAHQTASQTAYRQAA